MPVSNVTLMKIAAIGGFLTASMGFALRRKLNTQITQTEYYGEAINTLLTHRGVKYLLGEPILVGSIDVSDNKKNYTEHLSAHYEIPVKGSKQKGVLYFWANRKNAEGKWHVHRMELQLQNESHRRLSIKNEEVYS